MTVRVSREGEAGGGQWRKDGSRVGSDAGEVMGGKDGSKVGSGGGSGRVGSAYFRVSFLMGELVPPSPARPTWADRLGFQNVCARRRPGWGLPSMRPCVPSERSAPCAAL